MPVKTVLEISGNGDSEDINVQVRNGNVSIYNNATDATAWYVDISLSDWEEIKKFVNNQLIFKQHE